MSSQTPKPRKSMKKQISSKFEVTKEGFLNKRPKYSGPWRERYITLGKDEENDEQTYLLNIYRNNKMKKKQEAMISITLISNLLVSDVEKKSVRVNTSKAKKSELFVFKVYVELDGDGNTSVLLTVGSKDEKEANEWRNVLQHTIKQIKPDPRISKKTMSLHIQSSGDASKTVLAHQKTKDDHWQVVDEFEGVKVMGEKTFTKQFPTLKATVDLPNTNSKDVLKLILDDSKRTLWDENIESHEVVRNIGKIFYIYINNN